MVDFNAKEKGRKENVIGPHKLGIRNMRGEKLVAWCQTDNLIGNTWFQQPSISKWTWKGPKMEAETRSTLS